MQATIPIACVFFSNRLEKFIEMLSSMTQLILWRLKKVLMVKRKSVSEEVVSMMFMDKGILDSLL